MSDNEDHPHHADVESEASPPQYQPSPLSGPATELWLSKDTVLANRYRIERELGEGSMGRVYAAWDDELECRVAIKALRQILGTDALLAKRRGAAEAGGRAPQRGRKEERKKAAAGLAAAALALFDRGAFGAAETKLQEALSLDPAHAGAKAALDRCRAEKAAAEERRRRTQSQKTTPAVAKPDYGRRAAIGLVSVGILVVFIWLINSPNGS